jgi:tRNA(Arg) A34 adenosine deaminase TadA
MARAGAVRHSGAMGFPPNPLMAAALEMARAAVTAGEVPVGAAVAGPDGRVLAAAHNRTRLDRDPTAHAEVVAIRAACAALGADRLTGCSLAVTLEPCAMCAGAIAHARVARVYYAAADPKGGGVEHGARVFAQPQCNHRPDVIGGVAEAEAAALLREFFAERR